MPFTNYYCRTCDWWMSEDEVEMPNDFDPRCPDCGEPVDAHDETSDLYDPRSEALTPQERNPGFRSW